MFSIDTQSPSSSTSPSELLFHSEDPKQNIQNQDQDQIVEEIKIRVTTNKNEQHGFYYYAKKSNERFICQTDGCKMSTKKESKIKKEGVTRETLNGHATKYHSVRLNLKKRTGILQQQPGFSCPDCPKTFTRSQSLLNQKEKCHNLPNIESLVASLPMDFAAPIQQGQCDKGKTLFS